jgi:hypothetical protein
MPGHDDEVDEKMTGYRVVIAAAPKAQFRTSIPHQGHAYKVGVPARLRMPDRRLCPWVWSFPFYRRYCTAGFGGHETCMRVTVARKRDDVITMSIPAESESERWMMKASRSLATDEIPDKKKGIWRVGSVTVNVLVKFKRIRNGRGLNETSLIPDFSPITNRHSLPYTVYPSARCDQIQLHKCFAAPVFPSTRALRMY